MFLAGLATSVATAAVAAEVAWTNLAQGKMGWGQTVGPGDGTPGAPNNWTTSPDFPGETDDVIFDNRANTDGIWIGGPGYGDLNLRIVNSMTFRGSNYKRILSWSVESSLTSSRRLDIVTGLVAEADSGEVQMGDAVNASTGILRIGAGLTTFVRNDSSLPMTFGSLGNTGDQASIYGQRLPAGYASQPGAEVRLLPLEGTGTGGMVFNVKIEDGSTNTSGSRPLGVQVNVPNATVAFNVPNTYTGPTMISAGTLQVAATDALAATSVTVNTGATLAAAPSTTLKSPAVIVDGGTLSAATLAVDNTSGIASLAINAGTLSGAPTMTVGAGGLASLAQNARVLVGVGGLTVDQGSGGGRLDLGAGQVSVAPGGISAADLRADIVAGRDGGTWNGATGIMSSTAAAAGGNRAVGYVVAGDGSARVSFAAPGDTDLSGQVNVFDLIGIDSAGKFGNGQAADWSQGDFNYDGVANIFDLIGIDSSGAYGTGNYFPASPTGLSGSIAAVPEPAAAVGWALAGLAAAAICRRRRLSSE